MKTKFFYGMAAITTLGLAACSNDDLTPNTGQVAETDMTRYISVRIANPSSTGTRADNDPSYSVDNDTKESVVENVYFVFYDEDNNVVGDIVNIDKNEITFEEISSDPTVGHDNSKASSVVGVSIQRGEKVPSGVLVYINPVTPEGILNPLNVIETLKRTAVTKGTGDAMRFPMSNSVYYDDKNNLCNIVKINKDMLFDTKEKAEEALKQLDEAEKGTDNAALTKAKEKVTYIHVERYAAKVQLKWNPKKADASANLKPEYTGVKSVTYKNDDGLLVEGTAQQVTLQFTPAKWDVNAEGKDMFILKSYRQEDALGGLTSDNMTYDYATGNTSLGAVSATNNWVWNKPDHHRSFWGCSPAYYSKNYPEVASDYILQDGSVNPDMLLTYLKWDEVSNAIADANSYSTDYVRETTVGNVGLHQTPNHYASIPSIVVTGNYTVKVDNQSLPDNTTFYLYSTGDNSDKGIFFENKANSVESAATLGSEDAATTFGTSLLKRLGHRQQTLWVKVSTPSKETGKEPTVTYRKLTEAEMAQVLTIAHPTLDVLNEGSATEALDVKLAARRFTVQLSSDNKLKLEPEAGTEDKTNGATYTLQYNDGTNGYQDVLLKEGDQIDVKEGDKTIQQTVTAAHIAKRKNVVNQLLARNVGYADKYQNGMAYYYVPIKHYGWYRIGNENRTKKDDGTYTDNKSIDWSKTKIGDFGIVRNHHYRIEVTKVDGLATAISDTKTPIIPPTETEDHFIAYRLYILNWAILPVQNAEL